MLIIRCNKFIKHTYGDVLIVCDLTMNSHKINRFHKLYVTIIYQTIM